MATISIRTTAMESTNNANEPVEAKVAVEQEERSYTDYTAEKELAFDPLKDLNLPGSYQEVLDRFNKLQGERAQEVLN